MRVIDGMHRLRVAAEQGRDLIPAQFFDGSEQDAFALSVQRNTRHGLPLSTADRTAAANRILASHPEWSDRMIASITGLSTKTLRALRRGETERIPEATARLGRDGRLRPVDSSAGRLRASELIRANPKASLRAIASEAGISPGTVRDVRERMRRGENPLPAKRRPAAERERAATDPVPCDGRPPRHRPRDPASVLERLMNDPALRLTESGRQLLRLLAANISAGGGTPIGCCATYRRTAPTVSPSSPWNARKAGGASPSRSTVSREADARAPWRQRNRSPGRRAPSSAPLSWGASPVARDGTSSRPPRGRPPRAPGQKLSRQPSDAGDAHPRHAFPAAGPCNRGPAAVAQRRTSTRGDTGPLTLFCFHPAGGGTAFFSGWQHALGPSVRVVPVRLPGRDAAAGSHRHRMLSSLVAAVEEHLAPALEEPYLLYGHSMGALIAYHLTRLRAAADRRLPERLLVGAYPAPHLPHPLCGARHLTDSQLTALLLDVAALPASLRVDRRWLDDRLALVRADIALCDSAGAAARAVPLACPVEVFTGTDDPLVAVPDAAAWLSHTDRDCTLHTMPGGHFFTRESRKQFFSVLNMVLSPFSLPV
ncbi:thioesterase domain-containing protein [Streptomyces sp. 6N223]|uniref:thioesterase domain-containing protein n=1 Tax=Streptomyces sp. 6N223 TaxID=3457412 RepID=UPI003FD662A7